MKQSWATPPVRCSPIYCKVDADTILPLVDGERTMRLSALRWSVAEVLDPDDNLKKRARTAGTFFQQSEGTWAKKTAHSTLEDIAGSGSEVTLKLVLA
jgi:hypothetical protein